MHLEYLSEQELIDLANRVRNAANGDPIDSLQPSRCGKPKECLIATALNFQSSIWPKTHIPWNEQEVSGARDIWAMSVDDEDTAKAIAAVLKTDYEYVQRNDEELDNYDVRLPKRVGNTAQAFDNREGWTAKYATFF